MCDRGMNCVKCFGAITNRGQIMSHFIRDESYCIHISDIYTLKTCKPDNSMRVSDICKNGKSIHRKFSNFNSPNFSVNQFCQRSNGGFVNEVMKYNKGFNFI